MFLALAILMEMATKKLIAQESVGEHSAVAGERWVSCSGFFVDAKIAWQNCAVCACHISLMIL